MVDTPRAKNELPQPPQQDVRGVSLTDEEIADYQRLFKQEYGIDLTKDQALEKGLRLVRLLHVVLEAEVLSSNTK